MSSPRGRGLRPGSVVRAMGRLVVMIAIGFSIGLLFGLVTEEPELLSGHLRGESESVPLVQAETPLEEAALEDLSAPKTSVVSAGQGDQVAELKQGQTTSAVYTRASVSTRPLIDDAQRRAAQDLPEVAAAPNLPARPGAAAIKVSTVAAATNAPASARSARSAKSSHSATSARRRWAIQVGAFSDERAAKRLASTLEDRFPVAVLPAGSEGGRWRVRVQPLRGEDQARELAEQLKRDERLPTWVTPMEGRSGS